MSGTGLHSKMQNTFFALKQIKKHLNKVLIMHAIRKKVLEIYTSYRNNTDQGVIQSINL